MTKWGKGGGGGGASSSAGNYKRGIPKGIATAGPDNTCITIII